MPENAFEKPRVTKQLMEFCIKLVTSFDGIDGKRDFEKDDINTTDAEEPRHSVLVFLPGIREIEELRALMSEHSQAAKWDIVVLHSRMTCDEQKRSFSTPPAGHRRIIISTNIAESSITINDLKYGNVHDLIVVIIILSLNYNLMIHSCSH